MKRIKLFCVAALLTTFLSIPAWGGPMDTPALPPPPSPGEPSVIDVVDVTLEPMLSLFQSISLIF